MTAPFPAPARAKRDADLAEKDRRGQQAQRAEQAASARAAKAAQRALDKHRRGLESDRQRRVSELARLRSRRTTRPGEDVLGRLVGLGCLARVERPAQRSDRDLLDLLTGRPGRTVSYTQTSFVDRAGRRWGACELREWQSAAVGMVLGARIDELRSAGEGLLGPTKVLALPTAPRPRALAAGPLSAAELYGAVPRG